MFNDAILDQLRQLEREVIEGERRLAQQEAMIVDLKRQHQDPSDAEAELEIMRANQRQRQQDRQRLLSLMQR
ncbi:MULTISPECIES: hypothetical protein [Bradyrhizobium]|uniref:hypothetical protein n=1 Tax=Bradyrhizobium TaxID=374 RepID=UPI001BA567B9|nr:MULTISPECIES: hypothetical protein [Bradyrhizobium]MBR0709223.1 hypothetical protein [Bradyrhizobium liaoningense]MDA9404186.1 hypothetical protein [Bradyrhizobium sp. CCBAU 45389]